MKNSRSIFDDTLFIGSITIFSYFLYLMSEKGFLSAFGLGSEGLIPLVPQSIIPSILYSLMTALSFIAISFAIAASIIMKFRKRKHAELFAIYISGLIILVPVAVMLTSINIPLLLTYGAIFLVEPIILHKSRTLMNASRHVRNYLVRRKMGSNYTRVTLMLGILIILILPIYAYVFGYLRAVSSNNIRTVSQGDKQFIIVKQYEDKLILVQARKLVVLPKYKIQYLSSDTSFDVELVKGRLDFKEVQKYRKNGLL